MQIFYIKPQRQGLCTLGSPQYNYKPVTSCTGKPKRMVTPNRWTNQISALSTTYAKTTNISNTTKHAPQNLDTKTHHKDTAPQTQHHKDSTQSLNTKTQHKDSAPQRLHSRQNLQTATQPVRHITAYHWWPNFNHTPAHLKHIPTNNGTSLHPN